MSKKQRRSFSEEVKRQAVDDFVSGKKSAAQISAEFNVSGNMVYKWRAELNAKARGEKIETLESQGFDPKLAKRFLELEDEIAIYKTKIAEQAVHIDLLKKLRGLGISQPESELTGLINTMKASARKRKPVS
jgi:transposase